MTSEAGKTEHAITNKEKKTMSNTDTQSKLTPKQLLTGLLNLLETSDSVDDFTPEKLSRTFNVPLNSFFFDNKSTPTTRYGFIQRPSSKWSQGVYFVKRYDGKKQLHLSFNWEDKSSPRPDMKDVCEMTASEFITQTRALGFSDKPIRALGRAPILEGFELSNGKLKVDIRLTQSCIQTIRVR